MFEDPWKDLLAAGGEVNPPVALPPQSEMESEANPPTAVALHVPPQAQTGSAVSSPAVVSSRTGGEANPPAALPPRVKTETVCEEYCSAVEVEPSPVALKDTAMEEVSVPAVEGTQSPLTAVEVSVPGVEVTQSPLTAVESSKCEEKELSSFAVGDVLHGPQSEVASASNMDQSPESDDPVKGVHVAVSEWSRTPHDTAGLEGSVATTEQGWVKGNESSVTDPDREHCSST